MCFFALQINIYTFHNSSAGKLDLGSSASNFHCVFRYLSFPKATPAQPYDPWAPSSADLGRT